MGAEVVVSPGGEIASIPPQADIVSLLSSFSPIPPPRLLMPCDWELTRYDYSGLIPTSVGLIRPLLQFVATGDKDFAKTAGFGAANGGKEFDYILSTADANAVPVADLLP
jgi:hypothetical protein